MGQTADQIRNEIDNQRQELGDNLQQLEQKVKETVDWRAQFQQKPMLGIGIAFGAGLLLSALTPSGGDKRSESRQSYSADAARAYTPYASYGGGSATHADAQSQPSYGVSSPPSKPRSPEMNEISETLDNIRGALLGLGATRLRSFLAEAVPGFHQEYEQARKQRNASPQTRIDPAPSTPANAASGANQATPEVRQPAPDSSTGYMGSASHSAGTSSATPSQRP